MVACDECGARSGSDARFCPDCGAFLAWTGSSPPASEPPPAAAHTAPPVRQPEAPAATQPDAPAATEVEQALGCLDDGRRLATAQQRPDLARHLQTTRDRLAARSTCVAVVGEFKRGKSSLVNALLRTAVCPVDADIVTAVPTLVRHGDTPAATGHREPEHPGDPPEEVPLRIEDIAAAVADAALPDGSGRLRSVEVRLPHRLLRSGLCLLDTPGVGGLDSAHGVVSLGALDTADGVLFVTDASQELTAPELAFLEMAVQRCPVAACVVTKTDLHQHWRRIVDLDRGHLARAGLDLPVLPVSSFLRLRRAQDDAAAEESGFRPLVQHLAAAVGGSGARAATAAVRDVRFVAGQLGRRVDAEREALASPRAAVRVTAQLEAVSQRTAQLGSPSATWQQVLTDGVQDLVADVEHQLQGRLRDAARAVDDVIDGCDPESAWPDVEAWLRRRVAAATVAAYDDLARRAEELCREVGERFDLDAGASFAADVGAPLEALGSIEVITLEAAGRGGRRFTAVLLAARSASFVPVVMTGLAGSLFAPLVVVVAPVGVALAVGIGRKVLRDERARQLAFRRQQAKAAARRYLDEVGFVVVKDCRDTLRHTQRRLRDEFAERAAALHRSSVTAVAAARAAEHVDDAERRRRGQALAASAAELRRLQEGALAVGGVRA